MSAEWFETANGHGLRDPDNMDAGWLWSDSTLPVSP